MLTLALVTLLFAAPASAHRLSGHPHSLRQKLSLARAQVRHDRQAVKAATVQFGWRLVFPLPWEALSHRSWLAEDRRYVTQLQHQQQRSWGMSWLVRAFLCIHRYEGSWTDPNPPFYGGLQMDYGFQQTYGAGLLRRKGTADHWTPREQIMVAVRAHRSQGFAPWPNTSRMCGLA